MERYSLKNASKIGNYCIWICKDWSEIKKIILESLYPPFPLLGGVEGKILVLVEVILELHLEEEEE